MSKVTDLQKDVLELKRQLGYEPSKKTLYGNTVSVKGWFPWTKPPEIKIHEQIKMMNEAVNHTFNKLIESHNQNIDKVKAQLLKRIEQLECDHPKDMVIFPELMDRPGMVFVECKLCGKLLKTGIRMKGIKIEDARKEYR